MKIERDAWMVSGKIKFGGPVDFRFSYLDADDLEISCEVPALVTGMRLLPRHGT